MSDKSAIREFYLGNALEFTSLISVDTATSAKITIKDPSLVIKVNQANMTKDANKVYSYIYQSVSTDTDGTYITTIEIVYNGYTVVDQINFILLLQQGT